MSSLSVTDLGDRLYLIDGYMHGVTERLACWYFDTPTPVLIECGPSNSRHHLFAGLDHLGVTDVAVMAVTHIHLDHAGGAGHFAQRFPSAKIGVHAAGARHLADPTRLWDSAERIYGPEGMLSMWGPMVPIDEAQLLILDEGDRIDLGAGRALEVLYTPGHAKHHIVFRDTATEALFIGDSVGISFPHGHLVQPVTPPPDFDPHLVTEQLRRMASLTPSFLGFAHFGPNHDALEALEEAERRLWEWVTHVESAAAGDDLAESMRRWVLDGYRAEGFSEEVIATYDANTFWPMQGAGIARWLSQRSS